ncbi:hypothetical protein J1N35_000864, partial [Gossypium stocksii]
MYNVWRNVFPSIPDERRWQSVSNTLFKLLPDRLFCHKPKGQPMSTWIYDNMDIQENSHQPTLYGWCRHPGHTMSSCPYRKD